MEPESNGYGMLLLVILYGVAIVLVGTLKVYSLADSPELNGQHSALGCYSILLRRSWMWVIEPYSSPRYTAFGKLLLALTFPIYRLPVMLWMWAMATLVLLVTGLKRLVIRED